MQDRFTFRALVTANFYNENDEDIEIQFIVDDVDVLNNQDIGIHSDNLFEYLDRLQISQHQKDIAIDNFEANSAGVEQYLTITPKELIQCTGLKDKNGKLIFEGDIVEVKIGPTISRGIVEWLPNDACYIKGCCQISSYKKMTKVIGNIYENPELLKGVIDD